VDEEKPQISEKGQQGARWLRYSKGQTIMAVETENNSIPWQVKTPCAPLTLCANDKQVFYFDGEHVVSRDRKTGEELWKSEPMPSWNRMTANYGPRLVIHDDVVLFSGGENMVPHRGGKDSMFSFNIKTGKTLWTAPHPPSGYQSPEDLMVQGGLVWCGETTSGGQSGRLTGRDPKSGEVKIEFDPNVDPYWFHHRCYIAKATDNYLLMSRTGVEFVDPDKEDWEIHHWVRGACLYGILPANGMVYAPQHPCSCYPEAKLYGMNALAPAAEGKRIDREPKQRLIRGHAYGMVEAGKAGDSDWPTYRGSPARSGYTSASVPAKLRSSWTTKIGDRLSSVVVAEGKLFVADVDTHTVHALDADSGDKAWSYTVGGRVDSPPTVWKGRVYFGSTDGWVYCLRAENGELVWQFLAAPMDERHIYFEQLESVWPVHGSVLVLDEGFSASGKPEVQFVAGRNMFLDGGLWMYRLNAETGDTISVSHFDDRDPETGENLQERHQTLQMPVALSDILASNGKHVFMKSQVFDLQGNRREIGPNSGDFSKQVSIQGGEKAHIFCPTGYLDDEWWHRTYWVFGRSFAGGHGGYHRAGVFTPSGRILVSDGEQVFGFGRKPQYYKWTTPIEHQLFCANKPEEVVGPPPGGGNSSGIGVNVDNKPSLDPTGKPLTVEAWVMAEKPGGVIVARGGPAEGYALVLDKGKPQFIVRADGDVNAIKGSKNAVGKWVHIAGVLTADKKMQLYVDGELAASGEAKSLITTEPAQALQVGVDDAGSVGDYAVNFPLAGSFDEIRVYHAALAADQVKQHADGEPADAEGLVLHLTFDSEKATDESGNKHHGHVRSGEFALGKFGKALKLVAQRARKGNRGTPKTNVDYVWTADMPIFVRAMAMADRTLFVAGPPDIVDEEQVKNSLNDPETQALLAEQAAAIDGGKGSVLYAVSADDGSILGKHELKKLPVFDGMAAAGGRLYMATTDGSVICLGE